MALTETNRKVIGPTVRQATSAAINAALIPSRHQNATKNPHATCNSTMAKVTRRRMPSPYRAGKRPATMNEFTALRQRAKERRDQAIRLARQNYEHAMNAIGDLENRLLDRGKPKSKRIA